MASQLAPTSEGMSYQESGFSCSSNSEAREVAWQHLCEQHFERLCSLVYRLGARPDEVEDLVQSALVVALEKSHEMDEVLDPAAWLRGITVRVVLHHRRWWKIREAKRWLLPQSPITAQPIRTPLQLTSSAEDIESVRKVVAKLSPKLRTVLVLCDIEEMSVGEVSDHLGIPIDTVKSRRRLAKEKFMNIWGDANQ